MRHEVVVFDPEGILPEGKVFMQDERLFAAKRRGVVLLEVDSLLRERSALSPFAKFVYGDGAEVSAVAPAYAGKGVLWLARGRARVAWAGMLRHFEPQVQGNLRLVGDPRQPPLLQAPCSDDAGNRIDVGAACSRGTDRTWTVVQGTVPCQTSMDGYYAFALHGVVTNAKLAWLALTQAT